MALEWIAIAAGGAAGATLRYAANEAITRTLGAGFPWGILSVNVLGSLVMGVLYVLLTEQELLPEPWRAGLTVGLLGAFTTFSTFSLQTVQLIELGRGVVALGYCLASVLCCVAAALAGVAMTRWLAA